ncbi:MAG: hypothetical protein PHU44_00980 [Syntrophales bacterium]|nr:hypothetical protein [Syntrophales bacterium]MDD5641035.1 hypothetical protein [Syntrophales bacterium]
MVTEVLSAGVLGVVAILILGGLLALSAAFLPRLLKLEEFGGETKWGMGGKTEPGEPRETVAGPEEEKPAPVLPPWEPLAARLVTAEEEEDLVAAAIALALSLHQQEASPVREAAATFTTGSPWAMSGRWQAMQARLNRQQKR